MNARLRSVFIFSALLVALHAAARADESAPPRSSWHTVGDDLRYAGTTAWKDARSIVAAPLHVGALAEITPRQVLTGALLLAALGGTIALDETIRSAGRDMDRHTASTLQTTASTISLSSLGVLYIAGLVEDDEVWRHESLTGVEGVAVSSGLVKLAKLTFRRERPDSGEGSTAFFRHGDSFVSDAATPPYAAAEAVSAAFDHSWWATLPAYAMATAVGVGRIGQDRHWASDIVGSAYVGAGTTALFDFLHDREKPDPTPGIAISPQVGLDHSVGICLDLRF
jgi:hypothetical protein